MRLRHLAAVAVTAAGLALTALPVSAGTTVGSVTVSPSAVKVGGVIAVTGSGFPATVDVYGVLCGDDALNGTPDCSLPGTQEVATGSQGQFSMQIIATVPPVPCPCVVLISSPIFDQTPTAPVQVIGAPVAPLHQAPAPVVRPLEILAANLRGNGPWYSWFGGFAKRTLVLTVRNPNSTPYAGPPLVLSAGRPSQWNFTEVTERLPTLAPHQTVTVSRVVTLGALSFGSVDINGALGLAGQTRQFVYHTSVYPIGLVLVGFLVLQLILLTIRNSVRKRVRRRRRRRLTGADLQVALRDHVFGPGSSPVRAPVGASVGSSAGSSPPGAPGSEVPGS